MEKAKKKNTGIWIAAGLLVAAGVTGLIIWLVNRNKGEGDVNIWLEESKKNKRESSNSGYSTEDVKAMQRWMLAMGEETANPMIEQYIMGSGGVDGIIGDGFRSALQESINRGWVDDLAGLHEEATA